MNLFVKLRKMFFRSFSDIEQEENETAVKIAGLYKDKFPECYEFIECAAYRPEECFEKYRNIKELDGFSIENCYWGTRELMGVDAKDYLLTVYCGEIGVVAYVDWNEDYIEVQAQISHMLKLQGYNQFDWTFIKQIDEEIFPNELVKIVDQKLKGSGFRLNYLGWGSDSHGFYVVQDEYFDDVAGCDFS